MLHRALSISFAAFFVVFVYCSNVLGAQSDVWTCESYHPYQAKNTQTGELGPRLVARKRFHDIGYTINKIPTSRGMKVITYKSNDANLQHHFTLRALAFTGELSTMTIRDWMEGQVAAYLKTIAEASIRHPFIPVLWHPEELGKNFDRSICWRHGKDKEPSELEKWPKDKFFRALLKSPSSPGGVKEVPASLIWSPGANDAGPPKAVTWDRTNKTWKTVPNDSGNTLYTCKAAVYYRQPVGDDLSSINEIAGEQQHIIGPKSSAESDIRTSLVSQFKEDWRLVDESETCWPDGSKKPEKPSSWRGPTDW